MWFNASEIRSKSTQNIGRKTANSLHKFRASRNSLSINPQDSSHHPELLLQACRRRRVLEHQTLVGEDVVVGLLGHQGCLVEAAQDELELTWISVDIADREDARHVGLEGLGV